MIFYAIPSKKVRIPHTNKCRKVYSVLKKNNLSLAICVAISLSLGWWKDHLGPQGEGDPSATTNEVILPYRSPDESCFVFISYCLMILYHFQLRYMR